MTDFEVEDDTIRLVFTDPEYANLEARLADLSVGESFTALHLRMASATAQTADDMISTLDKLHQMFVDNLLEWNLTRKGVPVPQTFDGLRSLPKKFVGLLVGSWLDTVTGVSRPLPNRSDGGESTAPPEVEDTLAAIPFENLAS